jgi:hypothetical protein
VGGGAVKAKNKTDLLFKFYFDLLIKDNNDNIVEKQSYES